MLRSGNDASKVIQVGQCKAVSGPNLLAAPFSEQETTGSDMATQLKCAEKAPRSSSTSLSNRRSAAGTGAGSHPAFPTADWTSLLDEDHRMQRLEGAFMEELRAEVADRAARAPTDVDGFLAWFEALQDNGPGQNDPLFPWLANEAGVDDFRYFLAQEAAGEAGFDDLTALTQVKIPAAAKMELANNYWDEMGRGNPKGMHGPMLDGLIDELDLHADMNEPPGKAWRWPTR
jgi:hypothetical protein